MAKPFPLQTLLELAQEGSDAAAARLGAVSGHERDMGERLRVLLEYRGEYTERLARVTQSGMHSVDLRNFREFVGKIDAAIALQNELLAKAKSEVENGKRHWASERRKLKSFDALRERHCAAERANDARQEQKEQDELALKGFLGRRLRAG